MRHDLAARVEPDRGMPKPGGQRGVDPIGVVESGIDMTLAVAAPNAGDELGAFSRFERTKFELFPSVAPRLMRAQG